MSKIIVIGSSNIDMVAHVNNLPNPGETIGGATYMQANGGKGANQAVAAARLGGEVTFVTCLGDDMEGNMLRKQFANEGICTQHIAMTEKAHTGVALIMVSKNAENCIAVAPGANNYITNKNIDEVFNKADDVEYVLLQLEIPIPVVEYAIEKAYALGKKVILNPAPANKLSDDILRKVYLLTPNKIECGMLAGISIENSDDLDKASGILLNKGIKNIIVTLGKEGCMIRNAKTTSIVAARKVEAVDTTAAGDVFNGALVVALAENKSLTEAVKFATVCSSVSVTRMGAQPSIPVRTEIDNII